MGNNQSCNVTGFGSITLRMDDNSMKIELIKHFPGFKLLFREYLVLVFLLFCLVFSLVNSVP